MAINSYFRILHNPADEDQTQYALSELIKLSVNRQTPREDRLKTLGLLIKEFGEHNLCKIRSLNNDRPLQHTFTSTLIKHLEQQKERVTSVLFTCLRDWVNGHPPNLENLGKIYDPSFSLLSGENLYARSRLDVSAYLLSHPMPPQEALRLGCCEYSHFKEKIDAYQESVESALAHLFDLTNKKERAPSLTISEQSLLFRNIAIQHLVIYPVAVQRPQAQMSIHLISWARLYAYWQSSSAQALKGQDPFYLLTNLFEIESLPLFETKNYLTFGEYVIEATVLSLFKTLLSPYSFIPANSASNEIRRLLNQFDANPIQAFKMQQVIVYFLADVYECLLMNEFSFSDAYLTLALLIPDKRSPHLKETFHFLLSCICFIDCKPKLNVRAGHEEEALFTFILSLKCEGIKEPFARNEQNHKLYIDLIKQKRLSLFDCAAIAIKFACTSAILPEDQTALPLCPYLDSNGHWTLVQKIEEIIGMQLPAAILKDLLLFQLVKPSAFHHLVPFMQIRQDIIAKQLHSIAIPKKLYDYWSTHAKTLLLSSMTIAPQEAFPNFVIERMEIHPTYPEHMNAMISLLQMAAYPLPFCPPIGPLIPINLFKKGLQFTHEQIHNGSFTNFVSFSEESPLALKRFCAWTYDPNRFNHFLAVALLGGRSTRFTSNVRVASIFYVPTFAPFLEKHFPLYFKTLSAIVDRLGNEKLTDEDDARFRQSSNDPYEIPNEVFQIENEKHLTEQEKIFDALIDCAPHLAEYKNIDKAIKASIYLFICRYRYYLKMAIYSISLASDDDLSRWRIDQKQDLFKVLLFNAEESEEGIENALRRATLSTAQNLMKEKASPAALQYFYGQRGVLDVSPF